MSAVELAVRVLGCEDVSVADEIAGAAVPTAGRPFDSSIHAAGVSNSMPNLTGQALTGAPAYVRRRLFGRHACGNRVEDDGRMDRPIAAALALMHARFHEPLTVGSVAHAADLSSSRFAHLFRQEMGVSPWRYLRVDFPTKVAQGMQPIARGVSASPRCPEVCGAVPSLRPQDVAASPFLPLRTRARVTRHSVIREHLRRRKFGLRLFEVVRNEVTLVRPVIVETIRAKRDLSRPSIDVKTSPVFHSTARARSACSRVMKVPVASSSLLP